MHIWHLSISMSTLASGSQYISMMATLEVAINYAYLLTPWGRVTQICVGNLTTIGPDNGILLIRTLWTSFNEILSEINTFSLRKMYLKRSSAKWPPFCLRPNNVIYACPLHSVGGIKPFRPLLRICGILRWNALMVIGKIPRLTHVGRDGMPVMLLSTFSKCIILNENV